MLIVDQVRSDRCTHQKGTTQDPATHSPEWVNTPRSDVPAITHVDYSARIQTVDAERAVTAARTADRLQAGDRLQVLVNTSSTCEASRSSVPGTPTAASRGRASVSVLEVSNSSTRTARWKEDLVWQASSDSTDLEKRR